MSWRFVAGLPGVAALLEGVSADELRRRADRVIAPTKKPMAMPQLAATKETKTMNRPMSYMKPAQKKPPPPAPAPKKHSLMTTPTNGDTSLLGRTTEQVARDVVEQALVHFGERMTPAEIEFVRANPVEGARFINEKVTKRPRGRAPFPGIEPTLDPSVAAEMDRSMGVRHTAAAKDGVVTMANGRKAFSVTELAAHRRAAARR